MAKTGSNTKYRFRFDFPNSNYQAQLVMIPSETGAVANTYVDCDESMISECKLSWEFDKYPIGILNPTIDITFNLTKLPSDLQYLLINPYYDKGSVLFDEEGAFVLSTGLSLDGIRDLSFGNYYELSIKYVDDSDYTLVFQGVTSDVDPSGIANNTRKVTIESLGKTILSNIDIKTASRVWLNSGGDEIRRYVEYRYSSSNYITKEAEVDFYFWRYSFMQIETFWQSLVNQLTIIITRNVRTTHSIDLFTKFCTSLYKSTYSTDITAYGTALTKSTSYVISHIVPTYTVASTWVQAKLNAVNDNTTGGLFYLMKNSDYNTLWDFANMFCQSSLYKYNNFTAIAPFTAGNATTLDIEQISYNMDATANYEVLKEVSSQYLEDSGENTKEFKQANAANKTDNSYTLEHLFTNKIYVPESKNITGNFSGFDRVSYAKQINNGVVTFYDATTIYKHFKVHNLYNADLGNSKELLDYVTQSAYTFSLLANQITFSDMQEIEQQTSNNASLTAKCLLELFKTKTQTQLKFDMRFDDTIISDVNSLIFQPNLRDIYFDMTNFNTHYSTYSNNHILTKCEFDLLSSLASFETITRSW